jgi:hypothetical protein
LNAIERPSAEGQAIGWIEWQCPPRAFPPHEIRTQTLSTQEIFIDFIGNLLGFAGPSAQIDSQNFVPYTFHSFSSFHLLRIGELKIASAV